MIELSLTVRRRSVATLHLLVPTALAVLGGLLLPLPARAADPSTMVYGFGAALMLAATAISRIHRVISIIVFSVLSLPLLLVVFEALRALGGSNALSAVLFLASVALYGISASQMFFEEDRA